MDPNSGATVGGVTVRYSSDSNNFVFQLGQRADSTIKVKGAARLGLDEVPLVLVLFLKFTISSRQLMKTELSYS